MLSTTNRVFDMRFFQYTIISVCLTLYPFIVYYRSWGNESITEILIPVYVSLIFLLGIIINKRRFERKHILLILALFLVMTGDFLINLSPHMNLSVIPFTLTHVFFSVYYLAECRYQRKDLLLLAPVLVFLIFFVSYNYPHVKSSMLPLFLFYLFILSLMVWRALCYITNDRYPVMKRYLIITGSLCFFAADILVCSMQVYKSDSFIFWIWLVYPPALLLLSTFNYFEKKVIPGYGESSSCRLFQKSYSITRIQEPKP